VAEIQSGIGGWRPAPSRGIQQTTQRALQQVETHKRLDIRPVAMPGTHLRQWNSIWPARSTTTSL
jgi:hypothetical protein